MGIRGSVSTILRQQVAPRGGCCAMHEKEFGLSRRPFPATPDRAFYYPATAHETALAELVRAVNDDDGFALLIGAPGTGKTLLAHCLLERLVADVAVAFLTNSHVSDR